jgi:hypothetical protein
MCVIIQRFMGIVVTFGRVRLQQQLSREYQDGTFEALYGRKCRTLLNWVEPGERRFYGIDFVDEAEKRSVLSNKICKLHNHVIRVMQIRGEDR